MKRIKCILCNKIIENHGVYDEAPEFLYHMIDEHPEELIESYGEYLG